MIFGAQPGWLTVRCPRSEVVGCLCHVLRQQLPVGDPGGHLAVKFLVEEFFYSGTWNQDTTGGYRRKVKEGPGELFTVACSPQSCTGQQTAALGERVPSLWPPSPSFPVLGSCVGQQRSPFSHEGMKDRHRDALLAAPTSRAFCQRARLNAEVGTMVVLQAVRFGLTGVWLQQDLSLAQDLLCPVLRRVCPGQEVFKVGIQFGLLSLAQLFFCKLQKGGSC